MYKKPSINSLSLLSLLLISCLLPSTQCDLFKNGRFYFYPKDSKSHYTILRRDSLQCEINSQTADTSFWKIKWVSNCEFVCTYISGTEKQSKEKQEFYEKGIVQVSIVNTSKEYYVYEALFKSGSFTKKFNDTMWLKER